MRSGIIKHLLVMFFIFSIMEKTGVSVLSLITTNPTLTEAAFEGEEKSTSEVKEAMVKEYWLFHTDLKLPAPCLNAELVDYADEKSNNHLAYFPSVPTPPPNHTV